MKRAKDAGISESVLHDALDQDTPQAALADLIVQAATWSDASVVVTSETAEKAGSSAAATAPIPPPPASAAAPAPAGHEGPQADGGQQHREERHCASPESSGNTRQRQGLEVPESGSAESGPAAVMPSHRHRHRQALNSTPQSAAAASPAASPAASNPVSDRRESTGSARDGAGKTLPLSCVSTAFVTNTVPFLAVLLLIHQRPARGQPRVDRTRSCSTTRTLAVRRCRTCCSRPHRRSHQWQAPMRRRPSSTTSSLPPRGSAASGFRRAALLWRASARGSSHW